MEQNICHDPLIETNLANYRVQVMGFLEQVEQMHSNATRAETDARLDIAQRLYRYIPEFIDDNNFDEMFMGHPLVLEAVSKTIIYSEVVQPFDGELIEKWDRHISQYARYNDLEAEEHIEQIPFAVDTFVAILKSDMIPHRDTKICDDVFPARHRVGDNQFSEKSWSKVFDALGGCKDRILEAQSALDETLNLAFEAKGAGNSEDALRYYWQALDQSQKIYVAGDERTLQAIYEIGRLNAHPADLTRFMFGWFENAGVYALRNDIEISYNFSDIPFGAEVFDIFMQTEEIVDFYCSGIDAEDRQFGSFVFDAKEWDAFMVSLNGCQ